MIMCSLFKRFSGVNVVRYRNSNFLQKIPKNLISNRPTEIQQKTYFKEGIRSGPFTLSNVSKSANLEDYKPFAINGSKVDRKAMLKQMETKRTFFGGNIIFLGGGAVALCCLDLFERIIDTPWNRVTVIDMLDITNKIDPYLNKGAKFVKETLTEENYDKIFQKYIRQGDLVIDLTVDSGSLDFMKWCSSNRVFYINSSVEAWHSSDPSTFDPIKDCQFHEFDATELWKERSRHVAPNQDTTIIYGLGANPGLVNLFCKQNLEDIARYFLLKNDHNTTIAQEIEKYLTNQQWNKLSQTLGVKAIHISEIDTQVTLPQDAKKPGESVNTWSIDGMYYECVFLNSEIGWGTHEKTLPRGAQHIDIAPERGLSHVILLPVKGKDAAIRTWTPGGEMVAFAVTHEENYEITKDLTVQEDNKLIYRPTCNFAYRPSVACLETLAEVTSTPGHRLPPNKRILSKEIEKGNDILGVLTMGHLYNGWWTGSLLDIEETRELVGPNHNATTLQVAVGVMAGVVWMMKNPRAGILCATDLPHEEVLPTAYPFLGPFLSIPVSWKPPVIAGKDPKDEWQFESFSLYDKLGLNF